MRSGNLRHRVSIQRQAETTDGMGGFSLIWSAISGMSAVPAAIWPLSSKEQLDSMKLESVATHRIRIRYRSGITSKDRIVFGSRVFNIIGAPIDFEERGRQLDFIVSEDV